jgi:hypothetical protein
MSRRIVSKLLLLRSLPLPMDVIVMILDYAYVSLIEYRSKKIKNSILKKFIVNSYLDCSEINNYYDMIQLNNNWGKWCFASEWKRDWVQMQGYVCKKCGEYDGTCHNISRYCTSECVLF